MLRKAILIGSPNGPDPELPGVDVDLRDLASYLQSNKGGAWESNEIVTLRNPSKSAVIAAIKSAEYFDYVLITCSGHGDHHVYRDHEDTSFCLNKTEEIYISELNPKNKRHLVIVDVCRKVVLMKAEEARLFAANKYFRESFEDRRRARQLFDDAVLSTAEGRIVVYSCDKNQTAGDDGNGGVFTQSLIKTGIDFTRRPYGVLHIYDAFQIAKALTYQLNAPQSPTINAGRRRDFYPFAVSA